MNPSVLLFVNIAGWESFAAGPETIPGSKWVQLAKPGVWDAFTGTVELKKEHFESAVENWSKDFPGKPGITHPKTVAHAVPVNEGHAIFGKAFGWIHALEVRGSDLYGLVSWNSAGKAAIDGEEYLGLSIEITRSFEVEQEKSIGSVVHGAGLTNVAAVRGMEPLALSQGIGNEGLPALFASLRQRPAKSTREERPMDEILKNLALLSGGDVKAVALKACQMAGLGNPETLASELADSRKAEADLKVELAASVGKSELADKKAQFAKMLADGNAVPAAEDAFLKGDMVAFAEANKALGAKNTESLGSGEHAAGDDPKTAEQAGNKLVAEAEKIMASSPNLQFTEALTQARSANPALVKMADGWEGAKEQEPETASA